MEFTEMGLKFIDSLTRVNAGKLEALEKPLGRMEQFWNRKGCFKF